MCAPELRHRAAAALIAAVLCPAVSAAQGDPGPGDYVVTMPELNVFDEPTVQATGSGMFFMNDRVTVSRFTRSGDGEWAWACARQICGWVGSEFLRPAGDGTAPDAGDERDNVRVRVGEPPARADGTGVTKYAGHTEMTMTLSVSPRSCTAPVTLIVEFHPGGEVKGKMTGHRVNLLTCAVKADTKVLWLFGSYSGGPSGTVTLGTDDGQGNRHPGWLTGTYNRIAVNVSGTLRENNPGMEGTTEIRARLRLR